MFRGLWIDWLSDEGGCPSGDRESGREARQSGIHLQQLDRHVNRGQRKLRGSKVFM